MKKEEYATFDSSRWPLVKVTFAAHEPSMAEFDEYLNKMQSIYENTTPFVLVLDAAKSKYLSSELRIKQGNWLKKNDKLIKDNCLGMAYYIPSMMVRIILNGIFLIQKPACPYVITSTLQEAEAWARKQQELVSL